MAAAVTRRAGCAALVLGLSAHAAIVFGHERRHPRTKPVIECILPRRRRRKNIGITLGDDGLENRPEAVEVIFVGSSNAHTLAWLSSVGSGDARYHGWRCLRRCFMVSVKASTNRCFLPASHPCNRGRDSSSTHNSSIKPTAIA